MTNYDNVFPDGLGRLISNIVQLECAIRIALHLQEPRESQLPTETLRFASPGDVLPENYLTNWWTLGKLMERYNELEAARGGKVLDETIVDLRDALAHGRMLASTAISEYRLIRFSQPDRGMVRVETVETLTLPWLEQQIGWTAEAVDAVFRRIQELKPDVRLRTS